MQAPPRIAQFAHVALAGALLAGGGYALASGGGRTIHGCVVRHSHELLIQRRCSRGQSGLSWSQRGPAGPRGRTGATGPAGSQAVGAWGTISFTNPTASVSGENLAVSETGVGSAAVTVTGGPCANQASAVVATPETLPGTPPPIAYVTNESRIGSFGVTVGTLSGGTFAPQDGILVGVAVYCRGS
ncbi:MAG: hypothetical protein ACRDMJ_17025 [Solirubrobacteraceae bacterium]